MDNVRFGHGIHTGNRRQYNEDNYLIDPQHGLFVVADGMGGHDCGEYASQIVIDYVHDEVSKGQELKDAVERAHQVVLLAADQMLGLPGMGSTIVAMQLHDNCCELVWVGDSRAYLWDNGKLKQLTRDHSYVQQMIDEGEISEEEAEYHPYRNVITQALGAGDLGDVQADQVVINLCYGQQILLCSDGLTGEVSDTEITEIFSAPISEQEKVDLLIQRALSHGGKDNITVLVVSAPDDAPAKAFEEPTIPLDTEAVRRALEGRSR